MKLARYTVIRLSMVPKEWAQRLHGRGSKQVAKGCEENPTWFFLQEKEKIFLENSSLQKHTHFEVTKSIPKTTKQSPREIQLHWQDDWKQPNMEIQEWRQNTVEQQRGNLWKGGRIRDPRKSHKDCEGLRRGTMLSNPPIRRHRGLISMSCQRQ